MIELKLPAKNAKISLQTVVQKQFFEAKAQRAEMDGSLDFKWYSLGREGSDRSCPLPVSFLWEEKDTPETAEIEYYHLLVSETEDMHKPWVYITKECSYDVYNLKVGTRYFWCVQKNGKRSEVFSFETLLTLPRFLKVDHIANVRDIGGYRVEGGRIRQGLVYRGGEFELHMQLSPAGAEELRRLGIRTDLDMRAEAEWMNFATSENIGIRRFYVPSEPYDKVFNKKQRPALKNFFKPFTIPKNYPIYFHCWGGADRTGTFAFIIGAFLGMSYEDLIYEYEVTSLAIWGIRSRNYGEFCDFLELFMNLPGKTLREKSTTFLKKYAGITDKQLDVVYNILVEKDEIGQ